MDKRLLWIFLPIVGRILAGSPDVNAPWTVACFWTRNFNSTDSAVEKCNHVIYEDAAALNLALNISDSVVQTKGYKGVMTFKQRNPHVKVELSIGSWQTSKQLYDIARIPQSRREFIESSVRVLEKHNFDGLHLMWAPPAHDARENFIKASSAQKEKENLTNFIKALKVSMKKADLSFSFGIRGVLEVDCNMEVEQVYDNADLVFVYAYGYHGSWEESTGAYAPLYPGLEGKARGLERVNSYYMTVDSTWESLEVWGARPDKTILVISAKGNPFNLTNSSLHGINAPNVAKWKPQLTFTGVCEKQLESNWSIKWDSRRKQSYTYKDNDWISYEDACSVIEKKKFAKEKKFRGLALKDLSRDDASGECVRKTLKLLQKTRNYTALVDFSHIRESNVYFNATFPLLRIIAAEKEQFNMCNVSSKQLNLRTKVMLIWMFVKLFL